MRSLFSIAALVALPNCLFPGGASARATLNVQPNAQVQSHWEDSHPTNGGQVVPAALQDMLEGLEVMQSTYFDVFAGTWPDAIDWTAAVMGTQVSATLTAIVDGLGTSFGPWCSDSQEWEDIINKYYMQITFFYFGENSFGLRNQAFDDMLWVVLGWLENVKFADMYAAKRRAGGRSELSSRWHGLHFSPMAAHRARIFYELAAQGWDTSLCDGGMLWNANLDPYKNAITNELFTAASIGMYLHFPGDNNSAPFMTYNDETPPYGAPHDPVYLENAVKSYKWLKDSQMLSDNGLYQDGFHISGWHRYGNGTIDPGTGKCDVLNSMVYTYNQGVLLSASKGLWIATGARSYLDDGHALISSVMRATGWPNTDVRWQGLGRMGVMEEYCDRNADCSQDGQTFKGIFFHHLAEFCRPLRPEEQEMMVGLTKKGFNEEVYRYHMARCIAYGKWVEHNAFAASVTKNENGLFGMWWGQEFGTSCEEECQKLVQQLPPDAVDYRNPTFDFNTSTFSRDANDRGRGRTVETQGGGLAVLRAHWQWQSLLS